MSFITDKQSTVNRWDREQAHKLAVLNQKLFKAKRNRERAARKSRQVNR